MTRKDYTLIASVIADQRSHSTDVELWRLTRTAEALADALSTTNARFDRARFLRACGVED